MGEGTWLDEAGWGARKRASIGHHEKHWTGEGGLYAIREQIMRSGWVRVTADNPCPVCGRPDWCRIGTKSIHCMRLESQRPAKQGGWYHAINGATSAELPVEPTKKEKSDAELDAMFRPQVEKWRKAATPKPLEILAELLGVGVPSLQYLGVGWNGSAWTIPERNAAGLIIGVSLRARNGKKWMDFDSRHGLAYHSKSLNEVTQPILIVEGMTDTATALTLGLAAVGRPNNVCGGEMLVTLLDDWRGRIIVMGENDQREPKMPEGKSHSESCKGCQFCWPGALGANTIAGILRKNLQRQHPIVSIRYPPHGAKDLREWFNRCKIKPNNQTACLRAGASLMRILGANRGT